jgi:hypothetical protein
MVLVMMAILRTMRSMSRRGIFLLTPAVGLLLLLLRNSNGRGAAVELSELRLTALRHGGGAAVVLDRVRR